MVNHWLTDLLTNWQIEIKKQNSSDIDSVGENLTRKKVHRSDVNGWSKW